MNKFFTLFVALFFVFNTSQAQKTIELGKQWNEISWSVFSPSVSTHLYSFQNDTIINSKEYLELYTKLDTTDLVDWKSTGLFFREDSLNRIYIYEYGTENLLYDFNLVQNDTIQLSASGWQCELIVHQVDTIQLLNGESRKRIRFIKTMDDPDDPWYGYMDWIQGIGSTTSFYDYLGFCYIDFGRELLCFYKNDQILYSSPNMEGCFITPVDEIQSENNISLYPNPTNDELNIISDYEILETKIIGVDGKLKLYENNKSKLHVDFLAPGMYIIQIVTLKDTTIKRFIVN